MSDSGEKTQMRIIPGKLPKTAAPTDCPQLPIIYAVENLQGIGKRERQEDSFGFGNALDPAAISREGLMVVLADGMGGIQNGKRASEIAVDSVLKAFHQFDLRDNIPLQLETAVFDASIQVWKQLQETGGTTLVAGLLYDEKAYCISVGDSYIGLLHDGELVRLNRDHNVLNRDCWDALTAGKMDYACALQNPERDAVTHFLGMRDLRETDIFLRPLKLYPGDVFLFCSDGVSGVLTEKCIEECLCKRTPREMCQALEEGIHNQNHRYQDNYTALIVQCRSS